MKNNEEGLISLSNQLYTLKNDLARISQEPSAADLADRLSEMAK